MRAYYLLLVIQKLRQGHIKTESHSCSIRGSDIMRGHKLVKHSLTLSWVKHTHDLAQIPLSLKEIVENMIYVKAKNALLNYVYC